jgi:thiamine pyrophosphokinase
MFIRAMFLIVAGGEPPGKELLHGLALKADMIIAADKGAQYCLESGITPGLVVGDMDSLDQGSVDALSALGVAMQRVNADKDQTDTEIALDEAIQRGAKHVEILGAIGDRIDHTLANIHLLRKALQHRIEARITSETQQVFLVDSSETIIGSKGLTVSFLPLTEQVEGISLTGFLYEIEDASMQIGKTYGISNVVTSDQACVKVGKGILLAVLVHGLNLRSMLR